eukprot:GHRQ01018977.1.p1 GENE.GHRQ01018977.1~~GHRQ01018977.1.p1  ORF type:complete len:145 (-),score=68.62 GHRQ01018977.1:20-454(-)
MCGAFTTAAACYACLHLRLFVLAREPVACAVEAAGAADADADDDANDGDYSIGGNIGDGCAVVALPAGGDLSPSDTRLLVQQGGTLMFRGTDLVFRHDDSGILKYTDVDALMAAADASSGGSMQPAQLMSSSSSSSNSSSGLVG